MLLPLVILYCNNIALAGVIIYISVYDCTSLRIGSLSFGVISHIQIQMQQGGV